MSVNYAITLATNKKYALVQTLWKKDVFSPFEKVDNQKKLTTYQNQTQSVWTSIEFIMFTQDFFLLKII